MGSVVICNFKEEAIPAWLRPGSRTVLDGGLATEFERRGCDLAGPLWSARIIAEQPELVREVHRAYLAAGAQILLSASYQASALAFQNAGAAAETAHTVARAAVRQSLELAQQARAQCGSPAVLIAASLGPYGAALANGAEFHGNYGFRYPAEEFESLRTFHAERLDYLEDSAFESADLLAFETVPSLLEARAIIAALDGDTDTPCWISFTCRDERHTGHGDQIEDCARLLDAAPQVSAIGINCTAPHLVLPLVERIRAISTKPLVVYPNSGELWDAAAQRWTGTTDMESFALLARRWFDAGVQVVGGCCRTGPEHVRAVASAARKGS